MVLNPVNELGLSSLSRLRWACRRGMLELDVLLSNFLEERYSGLNDDQKRDFAVLLTFQDPDIFAWLMGHACPVDANLAAISAAIRHHAQTRF